MSLKFSREGGGGVVRWCWVNFQCRGVLLIWIIVGQGPIALAVGASGVCLDNFSEFLPPHLNKVIENIKSTRVGLLLLLS